MNKSDKRFITGLIKGLDTQVRHNGILMERLGDGQKLLSEGFSGLAVRVEHIEADVSSLNDRMGNVELDVSEIKERVIDYTMVRDMAKDHDIKLAKLAK